MSKHGQRTGVAEDIFTNTLAATGNVTKSCAIAKTTRPNAYQSRNRDEAFAVKPGMLQKRTRSKCLN